MSGRRLDNFRSGDRSEYLALYGLSRLAFVTPIPRQEDFGVVDMLGVLTRREGRFVYPDGAFFVQVKSNANDLQLDEYAIRWVTHHMDHPLLICVVDRERNELSVYSTSRLWLALFKKLAPTILTLKFNSHLPQQSHVEYSHARKDITVHLGPPIIRKTMDELEQSPQEPTELLAKWIRLDAQNIVRRRLGRLAVKCFNEWTTNLEPSEKTLDVYYHGQNHHLAERAITPVLIALARNYKRFKKFDKYNAVRRFLKLIE